MAPDLDEIIRRIWAAFATQAVLPMSYFTFADGSSPQAHRCEPDVLRWTSENSTSQPVHGWLADGTAGLLLQQHGFIREPNGQLGYITPLHPPTSDFGLPRS